MLRPPTTRSLAPLALLLATSVASGAEPDAAQRAEARRQFESGTHAFADKRYREAALAFEAASAVRANGTALYTAALAWDQADEPARAADDFGRALDTPGLGQKEAQAARVRLDELEKSLGTIALLGDPSSFASIDDAAEVSPPMRLHGAPGEHALLLRGPGGGVERRVVRLVAGETVTVSTEISAPAPAPPAAPSAPPAPAPPPPPAPAPPPPAMPLRRSLGLVAIGAGVAAAGAATILGLEALGARDAYEASPSREGFDHASSLERATNLAFIGAGVLAAGGVLLYALPLRRDAAASAGAARLELLPGVSGAALRGAF